MTKELLDQARESKTRESKTRISEVVNRFIESWQELFDNFMKCLVNGINAITEFWMIYRCPNRRIAHLAKYHKKARVRKKNIHRIMKGNGGIA